MKPPSSQSRDYSDPPIEEFPHGVTREWLAEGRIVVHTTKHIDNDEGRAVFFTMVKETMQDWHPDQPFLQMVKFPTASMIHFTPEAREQFKEVGASSSHLIGRVAIILPRTFVNMALRIFINRELRKITPNTDFRIFHSADSAETWLREGLNE
jgi:hypothetical protein